jgi:hypothetical protein
MAPRKARERLFRGTLSAVRSSGGGELRGSLNKLQLW